MPDSRPMNHEAYEAGYDAYWEGVDVADNPYNRETEPEEAQSWDEGWHKAREHDYDESEG